MSNKKTTQVKKKNNNNRSRRTISRAEELGRHLDEKVGKVSIVEPIPPTDYQFELGFEQSVSSGVVGIKGRVRFNADTISASLQLMTIATQRFEDQLEEAGYLVARKSAPKKATNGETYSSRRGNHNHMESESLI